MKSNRVKPGKHLERNQWGRSNVEEQRTGLTRTFLIVLAILISTVVVALNDDPTSSRPTKASRSTTQPNLTADAGKDLPSDAMAEAPSSKSDQEFEGLSGNDNPDSASMPKSDRKSKKKMKAKSDGGMKKGNESKMKRGSRRARMNQMPKCGKMGRVTPAMLKPHEACGKQLMHLRKINRLLPRGAQIKVRMLIVRRVRDGECVSCITKRSVSAQLGHKASDPLVNSIWPHLWKLNKAHKPPLLKSKDPNLILKGEYITIPIAIRDVRSRR